MISAVVLVNTDSDSQDKVIENLKLVQGVKEAHALYGVYDLMIKVNALSLEELKDIIRFRIKQQAGVTSSLTLMIVDN
jgi:DNA-binding Lrp family transcriptional regulator